MVPLLLRCSVCCALMCAAGCGRLGFDPYPRRADAGTIIDAGLTPDLGMDARTETDTGTDAGTDTATDARADTGADAGSDAGTDAGHDAGVDAGPSGCLPHVSRRASDSVGASSSADLAASDHALLAVWLDTRAAVSPQVVGSLLDRASGMKLGADFIISDTAYAVTSPAATSVGARFAVAWMASDVMSTPGGELVTFADDASDFSPTTTFVPERLVSTGSVRLSGLGGVLSAVWWDYRATMRTYWHQRFDAFGVASSSQTALSNGTPLPSSTSLATGTSSLGLAWWVSVPTTIRVVTLDTSGSIRGTSNVDTDSSYGRVARIAWADGVYVVVYASVGGMRYFKTLNESAGSTSSRIGIPGAAGPLEDVTYANGWLYVAYTAAGRLHVERMHLDGSGYELFWTSPPGSSLGAGRLHAQGGQPMLTYTLRATTDTAAETYFVALECP